MRLKLEINLNKQNTSETTTRSCAQALRPCGSPLRKLWAAVKAKLFFYFIVFGCLVCGKSLFAGGDLDKEVRAIETDVTVLNQLISNGTLQQEHLAAAIIKLNDKLDQLTLLTQELKKDLKASQPGTISKTISRIETIKKVIRYAIYTAILVFVGSFVYKHHKSFRAGYEALKKFSGNTTATAKS